MKNLLLRFTVCIFIVVSIGFFLVSNVWPAEKQKFITEGNYSLYY
jgi:hypothetical protein